MSNANDDANKTRAITVRTRNASTDPNVKVPPCLVLLSGSETYLGRQWTLNKPSMVMGRVAECEIHVGEVGISKSHCKFTVTPDEKVSITDLGATNKTILNGKELVPQQPALLKNNDQIICGNVIFKFLQKGILSETAEKARMQGELETARNVQASFMPANQEATYASLKICGRSRAASEIGGDWWWHWSAGDKAFALIADATGHGAAAALITSAARSAVSTIEDDAAVTIEKVYSTLSNALNKMSGDKITMSAYIVEFNLNTKVLRYINASHLPAILLPPKGTPVAWNTLNFISEAASPPLGSPDKTVHVTAITPPAGTRLVLFTDGLTERKNAAGVALNDRGFYKMLIEAFTGNPGSQPEFIELLMKKSNEVAQDAKLDDDITVVSLDFI